MHFKFLLCCCQDSKDQEEPSLQHAVPTESQNKHLRSFDQSLQNLQGSFSGDENSLNLVLSEKEIADSPKLNIQILESLGSTPGTVININAGGCINSLRKKQDSHTYIGSALEDSTGVLNDLAILEEEKGMGKMHLVITFNPTVKKYSIKDLGQGTGTFVRIDNPLKLKENYIISFGESHMAIQFLDPNEDSIVLKFLEGPKQGETYTFSKEDPAVLIGRMVDCRIRFDDFNMSRYQSKIQYDNEKG
mmetsp:Transcript_334/g.354  ORF Transcript_334/g.354 Transcript_334/m.354 type:complete len:247 (+) Transcript_334:6-746(+)